MNRYTSLNHAQRWLARAKQNAGGRLTDDDLALTMVDFVAHVRGEEEELDDQVADFHSKFRHPRPSGVVLPPQDELDFRIKMIREESEELVEALESRHLPNIAAECIDLLYVVLGTLVICGLRARPFFNLVHRANMAKELNPDGGKPIKPKGWKKPDCASLIDDYYDMDWWETRRRRG